VTARRTSSSKRSTRRPSRKMAGGSCLCGEVAFELVRSAGRVVSCHCIRCRRVQNAAHASNIFVDAAKFRWVRGESQVSNYGPPKDWHFGAAFCRLCGSTLPRVVRSVGIVVVPSATLDGDPGLMPAVPSGDSNSAEWLSVRDEVAQYA
jgi:hypothetical protein